MREGAKQRLIGATVIVALVVIFVPMLFEPRPSEAPGAPGHEQLSIPEAPRFEPDLKSEVFLGPEDSGVGGFEPGRATESRPLALPPPTDLDPASVAGIGDESLDADERESIPEPVPFSRSAPPAAPVHEAAPPRRAPDGMPTWVVQVASLGNAQAAGDLESRLRAAGFSAFVEQAEVRGKLYYRVRVGPELDRAKAERTAARLREQQKVETLIQSYP